MDLNKRKLKKWIRFNVSNFNMKHQLNKNLKIQLTNYLKKNPNKQKYLIIKESVSLIKMVNIQMSLKKELAIQAHIQSLKEKTEIF